MAERRLADPQQESQVAHAELWGQGQGMENPRSRRIGQQAEGRGNLLGVRTVDDPPEQGSDVLWVDAFLLAPLRGQVDR